MLLDSAGHAIDGLSWGSDSGVLSPAVRLAAPGEPLMRNLPQDTDTAADWISDGTAAASHQPATTSTQPAAAGTSGPTATATPTIDRIILSEITPAHEQIELYNPMGRPCHLDGWQLDDDDPATAPVPLDDDALISAHGFLVLAYPQLAELHSRTLRLVRPDGSLADTVTLDALQPDTTQSRFPVQGGGWQRNTPPTLGDFNRPAPATATPTPTARSLADAPTATAVATQALPASSTPPAQSAPRWPLISLYGLLLIIAPLTGWSWRTPLLSWLTTLRSRDEPPVAAEDEPPS